MAKIVHIDDYRDPVCYAVTFWHGYDDSLSMVVEDIGDDKASKLAVASALLRGAIMLADEMGMPIDELMSAAKGEAR